ncbi:MAG TPA: PhzF family phenazine biosynthesis protein [Chitinophagaceae bacterium]|nr:PhzF family phenazine biosynthesis protein [Chitinophagaceae bacterium]
MKLTLYQVDAFADAVFKGNPAAVIPLNSWLDAGLMQSIAAENNLSETVFFVRNPDSMDDTATITKGREASYHIRWFTPGFEIDLCGHATLASAFVIKNYIDPSVEAIHFTTEKVGSLRALCTNELYTLDFPARMPQPCEVPPTLFESLGISSAIAVLRSRDYFVVLPDEASVKKVDPNFFLIKQLDAIGVIVTAKGESADVVSRCFYPGPGVPEDPVTGSAHCNIIPYWCGQLGKTTLFAKQLSQRGGDLWCELVKDRVLMSGKCVPFMKGEIDLGTLF